MARQLGPAAAGVQLRCGVVRVFLSGRRGLVAGCLSNSVIAAIKKKKLGDRQVNASPTETKSGAEKMSPAHAAPWDGRWLTDATRQAADFGSHPRENPNASLLRSFLQTAGSGRSKPKAAEQARMLLEMASSSADLTRLDQRTRKGYG